VIEFLQKAFGSTVELVVPNESDRSVVEDPELRRPEGGGACAIVIWGCRSELPLSRHVPLGDPSGVEGDIMTYPATFELESPETVDRWRPLVAWLLAIPHLIVVYALEILGSVVTLISWFAILFTGKLPTGLAGIQVMILRYMGRTATYAGFLYGDYPPFDFSTDSADPGGSPVTVSVVPELEGRNRLTVGLRLIWIIPIYLFMIVIAIAAAVVWFIAFFAVIILGRWPQGMRDFVVKAMRLGVQFNAYAWLLTDEYPPFALTEDDSASADASPPPPPPTPPAAGEDPA
jgi:hypothetical protein